ncbi:uncharacterized protein [Oryza sativa Japonica Group]|uniref:Expressed protein n=3 Tax=Oryza TaxID=4527 RepID=Q2QWP2_ORYSJ|nr:uncharacterized protein LOC4351689 [Oryza sativa Japonica Group]ABA96015.1 expressed protein [Oryza sativa Japonica Group]KAF2906966.1 hypothetical protein DAI22_12g060300 [Oryza sativa Japonica Group]BAF29348.1 Os12g0187800 [Oryza sativa Japonica Group]BAT16184.1 Os12g0187800 [Oryza sativa Japonica Group]|eukprot:NP_001066329.1 Os12g0187800 [Oryza sativa Japonica Group]
MAPEMVADEKAKVEATGRMASIEMEPKTLTLDQLKFAREAALYVLSTKPAEEAIRIFTEGLKPVHLAAGCGGGGRKSSTMAADSSSDDDLDIGCFHDDYAGKSYCRHHGGGRRRRRRSSSAVEKDVATAPF